MSEYSDTMISRWNKSSFYWFLLIFIDLYFIIYLLRSLSEWVSKIENKKKTSHTLTGHNIFASFVTALHRLIWLQIFFLISQRHIINKTALACDTYAEKDIIFRPESKSERAYNWFCFSQSTPSSYLKQSQLRQQQKKSRSRREKKKQRSPSYTK